MNKNNRYSSAEKLKSRKALESLFAKGKSFSVFPIKVFYQTHPLEPGIIAEVTVHAGVGVSSRNFKKAVDRNRIKRLLREVYRTQKHNLVAGVQEKPFTVSVFYLFIGKELPEFTLLQESMRKVQEKFCERIKTTE